MLFRIKASMPMAERFVSKDSDLAFAGVLAGNNAGKVWVDEESDPQIALVWSDRLQTFRIMGTIHSLSHAQMICASILEELPDFLRSLGLSKFRYSCDSEQTDSYLQSVFADQNIQSEILLTYKAQLQGDVPVQMPAQSDFSILNRHFLSEYIIQGKSKNPDFLRFSLLKSWGSIEQFLSLGFGAAGMQEDILTGFAMMRALYKQACILELGMLPAWEKQAPDLMRYTIQCLQHKHMDVYWQCLATDMTSRKVAEKVSVQLLSECPVFWFEI